MYYEELVRREEFDVDAQEVRRYFDFERVRAGLLDITGRLFGIEYVPREDVAVWHEDVTAYDVRADGGRDRAHLPRPASRARASSSTPRSSTSSAGSTGRQLPEGALVCNFPRGLMEHSDVVTLFHEFGHLVHHVLGGHQRWVRFSGVATEWDFVEAPSQMLEEWAWDADVLRTFAADADGTPIPGELVARMRAAEEFGKGYLVRNQMFYAALSYVLHRDRPADLTAAVPRAAGEATTCSSYIDGTHFHAASGTWRGTPRPTTPTCGAWSSRRTCSRRSILPTCSTPGVAQRYRDQVLAPGGAKDAADLVAAFLGRPYSFDAFTRWLDAVPVRRSG